MNPVRSETLAFLAPGLLHHLGNILFTIQGNAQLVGSGETARVQQAILGAAERGSGSLRVLRHVLGDPNADHQLASALLQQVADLARIPVREAQLALELRNDPAVAAVVDAGDFSLVVLEALRRVVAAVPSGTHGAVVVELRDGGPHHATVMVTFRPTAGELPFPLATAGLAEGVAGAELRLRSQPRARATATGIELVFPANGHSRAAEA